MKLIFFVIFLCSIVNAESIKPDLKIYLSANEFISKIDFLFGPDFERNSFEGEKLSDDLYLWIEEGTDNLNGTVFEVDKNNILKRMKFLLSDEEVEGSSEDFFKSLEQELAAFRAKIKTYTSLEEKKRQGERVRE